MPDIHVNECESALAECGLMGGAAELVPAGFDSLPKTGKASTMVRDMTL